MKLSKVILGVVATAFVSAARLAVEMRGDAHEEHRCFRERSGKQAPLVCEHLVLRRAADARAGDAHMEISGALERHTQDGAGGKRTGNDLRLVHADVARLGENLMEDLNKFSRFDACRWLDRSFWSGFRRSDGRLKALEQII